MPSQVTHLDSAGRARMVNVGGKAITARSATAEGFIRVQRATLDAIANGQTPKGDVLAAARLAGILAAKRTGELIPLCHPLPIESVNVEFDLPPMKSKSNEPVDIHIRATATITAKTGVEMEALTAVSIAALTIFDMCKAIDKTMLIHGIRVIAKTGGKSGDFVAGAFVANNATAPATRSSPRRRKK
jgi:cyclic pyranopterin phosphate synthase